MGKITNILIHPAFLALIITFFIIWILPQVFNKYEVELLENQHYKSEFPPRIYYHDFDHDGNSEKVMQGTNGGTLCPYFCFYSNDGIILDQWNFGGTWIRNTILFFGDYDNNGLDEIYGFTWENDSVFINGIEPIGDNPNKLISKFLFLCPLNNKQIPLNIRTGKVTDLDGDKYDEIVFSVNAGYNLQPRAVFAYDRKNDSIFRSPYMGASNQKISFVNLDNDPYDEILIDNLAHRNYATPISYSDSINWFIVLDNDLNFLFEPIPLDPMYISSKNYAIENDKEILILNIQKHAGISTNDAIVSIFNKDGKLISKSNQSKFSESKIFNKGLSDIEEKLYITSKGDILEFNSELIFEKVKELENRISGSLHKIDLENDSIPEFIFSSLNKPQKIILRNDFDHPVILDVLVKNPQPFSVKHSENKPDLISINSDKEYYLFEYRKNPYYFYKYPFYIGIYLVVVGFFTIISLYIQNIKVKKRYETERELNELKMITIRNQMNPHFTFNAINSISSIIYKEDKKTAYDFFTKFSDLIRYTIKNADKIAVPLSEEIEFVTNYLELEKFRFKEKFEYIISVDRNVDKDILVPRMIIQTFAENAVKHGLSHMDNGGVLKIHIGMSGHYLNLIIEDNGIGREASGKFDNHGTGKGMKIITQIFDLYHKLTGMKITHSISDLQDNDNQPRGTKINVEMEI